MELLYYPHFHNLSDGVTRQAQVVVIDVLRATTTITAALAAGISAIRPCATLSQARQTARTWIAPGQNTCLAGERHGRKPPGFDYGNSPLEFSERTQGRLVMTTSNGTRALQAARPAPLILAVCLNNLSAATAFLRQHPTRRLIVLAAGEQGRSSAEDSLTAGLFIQTWLQQHARSGQKKTTTLNARAEQTYQMSQGVKNVESFLFNTPHGRELCKIGFAADIRYASRVNSTRVLGRFQAGLIQKISR